MFDIILKQIKTKYKDLGLKDNVLKAYATKLDKAVKEEDEIADAVDALESDLRITQSLFDQNRTLREELESLKRANLEPQEPAGDPTPTENEVPQWVKAVTENLKNLEQGLNDLKQERKEKNHTDLLLTELKDLNVSEKFYQSQIEGRTFGDEQEIKDFARKIKENEDNYLKDLNLSRLEDQPTPTFGTPAKEGEVSAAAQAYIQKLNPNEN